MRFNRAQAGGADERLRHACDELRRRLRAGEDCRAEDFLSSSPPLDDDSALRLIHAEWAARFERGDSPPLADWLARFPRLRDRLERHLLGGVDQTPTVSLHADADAAEATHTAADPEPGEPPPDAPLPPHDVGAVIGRGSMGVVHRAYDRVLRRDVALKIRPSLVGNPAAVARFYHEARAAAQLHHPHIVPVYVMGWLDGEHCFTMPLLPANLEQRRARFAPPRAAAALVAKVAGAVHAAHERGVVHRDLKPGNILLDDAGEPLVADFGLALLLDAAPREVRREGTPAYMAPEQTAAEAGAVGRAADVWALGVILYELVSGRRPFEAASPGQLEDAIRREQPASPATGDPRLDAVVRRCLAKRPEERFATAQELADALRRWLDETAAPPPPRRRWPLWAAVLLAAAGLATFAVLASRSRGDPDAAKVTAVHRQLDRGQVVPWLTAEGAPLRTRWVEGDGGASPAPEGDGSLRVNTQDSMGLVELLPAVPRDRYRLTLRLRTAPGPSGRAGLYFFHRAHPSSAGPWQTFVCVSLADVGTWRGHLKSEYHAYHKNTAGACGVPELKIDFPPTPGEWHALELEVTPDRVRVALDGRRMGELGPDELAWGSGRLQAMKDESSKDGAALPPLDRRGGLGLFVCDCTAWYRDVVLHPE